MTTTSETLFKAAELIEKQGWVQGWNGWTCEGIMTVQPLCLEGGILAALGIAAVGRNMVNGARQDVMEEFRKCPAYVAVFDHLGLEEKQIALCGWNDTLATGKDEVVEVLRTVAEKELIKESELVD